VALAVGTIAIGNPEQHVRKASTVAASDNWDHASQSLFLLLPRATYIMVLFFKQIPFVVNHTINAMPRERLQKHPSFLQRTTPIARSLCEGWTRHNLHILVTSPFCCDRKSQTGCAQRFHRGSKQQWRSCVAISLTIACSRYIYKGVILQAHPVRGESHNQRNATGEFATVRWTWSSGNSCYVSGRRLGSQLGW